MACYKAKALMNKPEMMGTLLICISKMATPGRLQFSYAVEQLYVLS
jgi:hypothetical protein